MNHPCTSTTPTPSDLDRLSLALGLSLSELDELLSADAGHAPHRLTFERTAWQERKREYNRRYYESVRARPDYRAREAQRVAVSRGRLVGEVKPSGKATAYQKRLRANQF